MKDIEQRIDALMARMNLDQKAGQIVQPERMFITPAQVREYHIGSVLSGGGSAPGNNVREDWIQMNDAFWAASMVEAAGHLAIPLIYGVDAIHGHNSLKGAVIFPHNIGLGAARDPDLIERIGVVTAREVAATGLDWTFAPTLAVARNDHWGRTYESFAEDTNLVSEYAPRMVKGLQGNFGEENVIACVKHWVGDGTTEHGIDQGDSCVSEEELRRIHIPPFRAAIQADVLTVMVSLSSWNQNKCHGHKYLLTDILKNELGFAGFIASDWDGIDYLSPDFAESVALGLNAGLDMFMVTEKWKAFIQHVKTHVEQGRVPMARLDDAVRRILRVKLKFGLFDKPRPAQRKLVKAGSCLGLKEHREIARDAVRKSLVLLKNEGDLLPLNKNARILVAGKNAHNRGHQCGGFTIAWQGATDNDAIIGGTSVWEGLKAVAPNAVLSANGDGTEADPAKHDVGIVVIGEKPYAEVKGDLRVAGLSKGRGAYASLIVDKGEYGTHLDLCQLHPEDLAAIQNVAGKGIPVVVIMICGRPLVVNPELEASQAFVVAWLPGSEGQGVADVIFGDFDFHGKLSFSWPRYDHENWNMGDANYNPLFPYGYGLTYKKH